MSYFQNPFTADFHGVWVLGDRQLCPEFRCYGNRGRGDTIVGAWTEGPYNLSGNDADSNATDTLVIKYALNDRSKWHNCTVDIAAGAASSSAVTPGEIVANLNANDSFSTHFIAKLGSFDQDVDAFAASRVLIEQKKGIDQFWFYVVNGQAEEKLNFNYKAGVAELPDFFDRHTVGNTYSECQHHLIELDPSTYTVDANVIDDAVNGKGVSLGLDSSTVQSDYQMLEGRSGIFTFQKNTVDGSDRITEIIEYHAGAKVGDLARKIAYTYTSTNTKPDQVTEIPYILTSGDLVTP